MFHQKKDDWKKYEKINVKIVLNILYAKRNRMPFIFFKI